MIFYFRPLPAKTNDKVFWNMEKNSFLFFRAMRIFLINPALSGTTSRGFLSSCRKVEKTNDQIPRKFQDRRTNVRIKRPYFLGPSGHGLRSNKELWFITYRLNYLKDTIFILRFWLKGKFQTKKIIYQVFIKFSLIFQVSQVTQWNSRFFQVLQVLQVRWQPWAICLSIYLPTYLFTYPHTYLPPTLSPYPSPSLHPFPLTDRPTDRLTERPNEQSTNQPTNQTTNRLSDEPTDQSTNRPANQWINRSTHLYIYIHLYTYIHFFFLVPLLAKAWKRRTCCCLKNLVLFFWKTKTQNRKWY